MLKQLRHKFILINMLLVSLVLTAVFAALVLSTARQLEQDSIAAMEMAMRWRDRGEAPFFAFELPGPDREGWVRNHMIPTFCVIINAEGRPGEVVSGSNTTVSDEVLEQAVAQALESGQDHGALHMLGLRFLLRDSPEGERRLAFSDMSWERASQTRLIISSLLVGLVCLACFFLISLLLSRVALRPVEQAWAQQGQFVADASHELKTPLTVILANTGIVLSHPEQRVADNRKWLEYIQEEAQQMKALVEDLLFLAKNDAAQLPAAAGLNFSDLVEGCLLRFESVAFERGVALDSRVKPGLSLIGDKNALERLVMILLDNAVKYAGAEGRVFLLLEERQDRAFLSVQNTGEPISPEHLPHLFKRFYRVDGSRSREQGGYGLGLSIAQAVTRSHRGDITVASDAAQGTVFTVSLPIH